MTHYLKTEIDQMRAFERYWQKKRVELSMIDLNSPEFHIAADAFRKGYDAGFEAAEESNVRMERD